MKKNPKKNAGIARMAAACGLGLLAVSGVVWGQAPRYQSPFGAAPVAPSLPTPAAITPNGTVVEDVVAKVNDQIVSRSDVERSEEQLQQELQQQNASPADREQREKDMLRDMIDQQLLLSRGKELGLNADAEVVRRLDEIRKQNHLDSMEALERAAQQQGVSFADFKANIHNGVITQQVVRDEVGRRLQMTKGQEQTYYDAHKTEFEQPEQVRLSEILIPTPADATEAAVAQAKKKAETVEAKIIAGSSFDEAAKQNSGGPTAAQGGDLGLFKRGALAKVLEDQTFSLKAGQITAPIRTKQGFVILKVTEHQDAGIPPLKQVEPQIQEAMYNELIQPALRAYLTKLREEAYIDIKPGFVDSGASPRETKPVFTAYAPPAPKKKTSVEKARLYRSANRNDAALASTSSAASPSTTPSPTSSTPASSGAAALPGAASGATSAGAGTSSLIGASGSAPQETVSPSKAGADAVTTPSADGRLSGAKTAKRVSGTSGKRKKIRREKVRFGQAPRDSLPAGPTDIASGRDVGAGAESAAVTPGALVAGVSTPGTAIAPVEGTTTISSTSDPDPDPLAPKVVTTGKTRFSAREVAVKQQKVQVKTAKVQEKIAATPVAANADEVATRKQQSAPLGLNGDTVKKKKVKRKKGDPKERLQEKPKVDAAAATPVVSPTVNPALGANPGGTKPEPAQADPTTLAPVTAPAPGAPPTGQPLAPNGAPTTTPNGTSAPPL